MAKPIRNHFAIDGHLIKAPDEYKPVFATTSTADSVRDQSLVLHNTPIGTIAGYDMKWGVMTWEECANILNLMLNKSSFQFRHKDPTQPPTATNPEGWVTLDFYASNFNMAAQTLEPGNEGWTDLAINVRRIRPR